MIALESEFAALFLGAIAGMTALGWYRLQRGRRDRQDVGTERGPREGAHGRLFLATGVLVMFAVVAIAIGLLLGWGWVAGLGFLIAGGLLLLEIIASAIAAYRRRGQRV